MKSRTRQFLILLMAILAGIIVSSTVSAEDFHRAKTRHFRHKYKTQLRLARNECEILYDKRNDIPNIKTVAIRKPKHKPQAEIDEPAKRNELTGKASAGKPQNKRR